MSAWLKRHLKFLIDNTKKPKQQTDKTKQDFSVWVCIYEDSLVKQGRQESEELRMVNYETSTKCRKAQESHTLKHSHVETWPKLSQEEEYGLNETQSVCYLPWLALCWPELVGFFFGCWNQWNAWAKQASVILISLLHSPLPHTLIFNTQRFSYQNRLTLILWKHLNWHSNVEKKKTKSLEAFFLRVLCEIELQIC